MDAVTDTAGTRFADRAEAGRILADALQEYAGREDVTVFGLARGGVPVAYEVARLLEAPLDVFMVRKLGFPGHEELAMGAIASGGVRILNQAVLDRYPVSDDAIAAVAIREQEELERRQREYTGGRSPLPVDGRTVILVDDGLATGASMRAAAAAVRSQGPAELVIAVPVAAPETCREIEREADVVVCARTPEPFRAVGLWYTAFGQTTDDEVKALLERGGARAGL